MGGCCHPALAPVLLASPREVPGRAGGIQGRADAPASCWDVSELCVA